MRKHERKTLLRLLGMFKAEYPRFSCVAVVLALVQSLDALEELRAIHKRKVEVHRGDSLRSESASGGMAV